jgi:fatty-acyl-CoA synthase
MGGNAHAFVVLRPGFVAVEKEIYEFCRANLAGFKAPKGYSFVAELPKTATGKVEKYVLRGKQTAIARQ